MNKIEHIGIAVKDIKQSNQLFELLFGEAHYKIEDVKRRSKNGIFSVWP